MRCLQATGEPFAILPIAFTYDRIPEQATFLEELRGAPKPKMQLLPLLGWTLRLLRGEVDVGRVHLTCEEPLLLDPSTDVPALSRQVIARLQRGTATTTYQLRTFLIHHSIEGVDLPWLREAVIRRGGQVLESDLRGERSVGALVERCMRYDWMHLFYPDLSAMLPDNHALRYHIRRNGHFPPSEIDVHSELGDSRVGQLLRGLFESVCRDYLAAVESLGSPTAAPAVPSARELVRQVPKAHLPTLEEAFDDLIERHILARDPETDRYVWGPRASDLADYRKACAWPGVAGELRNGATAGLA